MRSTLVRANISAVVSSSGADFTRQRFSYSITSKPSRGIRILILLSWTEWLVHFFFHAPKMLCLLFQWQYWHRGTCWLRQHSLASKQKKKKKEKGRPNYTRILPKFARFLPEFLHWQFFFVGGGGGGRRCGGGGGPPPPSPSRTPMAFSVMRSRKHYTNELWSYINNYFHPVQVLAIPVSSNNYRVLHR